MIYLFKHTPSKYGEGGYVINRVCVGGGLLKDLVD